MDVRIPQSDAEGSVYGDALTDPLRHFDILGPGIGCILEPQLTVGAAGQRQVLHTGVGDVNAVTPRLASAQRVARQLSGMAGPVANCEWRGAYDAQPIIIVG